MNEKLKFRDYLGYALGDTAGLMTFALISSFLQIFYTDSLGIAPAKIAVLMLVARVWDAVNDPVWGSFIDSRKPTKHGRFRPYILGAAFPLTLAALLLFFKIPGLTEGQYLIYAYITYIFYGMMYTGTNIPYGSLAGAVTVNPVERSNLSMWRSVGAGLGGLPAQILLPLIVYDVAEGSGLKVFNQNKFYICIAILAFTGLVTYYAHFRLTKERVTLPPTQKTADYNVLKSVKALIKNRPFITICLVSMLLIAFQMYTQTTYNYLFKDYFNNSGLYALVTICTYLPMAIFIPFMNRLIAKAGKKKLCAIGLAVASAANTALFLIRGTSLSANPFVFLALVFVSGAGQTFLSLEVWALVMEVTDYHEQLSGRKEEGTTYSFYNFVRKIGHTLAGTGSSALLGLIGYDVSKVGLGQSSEVLSKLYDIATLVPAVMLILMFVLLSAGYKFKSSRPSDGEHQ